MLQYWLVRKVFSLTKPATSFSEEYLRHPPPSVLCGGGGCSNKKAGCCSIMDEKSLISSNKLLALCQPTKWVLHPDYYPTLAISASLGIDSSVSEMVLCCIVYGIPPPASTSSTSGALVLCPPALFAQHAIVSYCNAIAVRNLLNLHLSGGSGRGQPGRVDRALIIVELYYYILRRLQRMTRNKRSR
jgi:hypothetical protein